MSNIKKRNLQISLEKNRPFKTWGKGLFFNPKLFRFSGSGLSDDDTMFMDDYFYNFFFVHFRSPLLRFRRVVLRARKYGYVSANSIEAFRKILTPFFRKKAARSSRFYIRCFSYLHLTRKPAEVRMGGGKGAKSRGFYCPVKPGQILFEVTIRKSNWVVSTFRYAARKLSVPTSIHSILRMFININSKLPIIDNSGCSRIRSINFRFNRAGYIGDLYVGSLHRVKTKRRIKRGQIFRGILVQSRRWVFRPLGTFIRSLAYRSILIKKNEYVPLANRINGFYFLELRLDKFKFSALTVYCI
jgi:large subunit ribosomal protein L16